MTGLAPQKIAYDEIKRNLSINYTRVPWFDKIIDTTVNPAEVNGMVLYS